MGGVHLYDALYPYTEKNGIMDVAVTYKANEDFNVEKLGIKI